MVSGRDDAPTRFSACKLCNLKRIFQIFQRAPYPVENGNRLYFIQRIERGLKEMSPFKESCIVLDQQLISYLR